MSTTSKTIVAGLVALAALLSTSAFGATIQSFPNFCSSGEKGVDCYLVTINGSIVPGDFEKFEAELKRIDRANPKDGWYGLVGLQSDGGNPVEAMKIGRLIRKWKLPTYVGSNVFCASACAIIWVAGSKLQAEPTAKVGFHAAYLVDGKKRFIKEYGAANALIGAYYSELGYSAKAIFYMTSAAPNQMAWLKTDEGLKMGFNIATQQPAAAPKKIEPGSQQAATTPVSGEVSMAELMLPGPLGDRVLGAANAPVTIVEYASMTCPHCANFHETIYPELKKKYVDTGKVRFIFREFPLDPLAAAGSMLARCAGKDKFFPLIETLFAQQKDWVVQKPLQPMFAIVRQAGFTEQSFDQCLENQQILQGIEESRNRAAAKFNVTSTPTFFINGKIFRGSLTLEELDKQIASYLKG